MKIIKLLCCLLLVSTTAFCQKNKLTVLTTETIAGKNLISNTDIKGTEFLFSDKIHELFCESETNFATVQLIGRKNSGNILQYNLKNKSILWTKPISYDTDELLKFDNLLIFNEYNEAYVLDNLTGDNLSKVMNYIYFANPEYKIGFAYLYLSSGDGYYTNDFMGIDLLKRKLLWKRNINRQYGWNDFFYLNDSTLMVVAAGLHTINIKTGEGWDYNTVTGEGKESESYPGMAFGVMGAMLGGLIGALIGSIIDAEISSAINGGGIIRDFASNALLSKDFIYFASKEKLVKIHKESGIILWKTELPKEMTSKSSLFMDDKFVYMVNYGYATQSGRKIYYGKTFIAAFDKLTGKEKYLTLTNHHGQILDYKQIDNEIYLLFSNVIAKYSLETGNLIFEKKIQKNENENFQNFADDKTFLLVKNIDNGQYSFFNFAQIASKDLHANTNQGRIISIDNEINITKIIGVGNYGINYLYHDDYKLISKENKTFVIDYYGKIIAELDVSSNAFIVNDILYDKKEKSFIAIDLKNL